MQKEELQGVSEQQREVWAEALRGMTPEDATGDFFMWKEVRPDEPHCQQLATAPVQFEPPGPGSAALGSVVERPCCRPLRIFWKPRNQRMRPVDRAHNRANAKTCGYVNLIPAQQEIGWDRSPAITRQRAIGSTSTAWRFTRPEIRLMCCAKPGVSCRSS